MASATASGAMLGLFMASVFITASMLTLFFLVKDTASRGTALRPNSHARSEPYLARFFRRHAPGKVAMAIVAVAYPFWAVVGGVLGLLYYISVKNAPGGGLGSPNAVFTVAIVVVALVMAAPVGLLLRRVVLGVIAIALAFMGVFGWFLPHFVG